MANERALRAMIIDDEPLAIARLEMLFATMPGIELVGTAEDGEVALDMIPALAPDLLLLDIAMPELDGIAVARLLDQQPCPPAVVFCTAFQDYAFAAFEVAAVDFLLKPVDRDRLVRALDRVRLRGGPLPRDVVSGWLEELWVPHGSEMIRIGIDEIDQIAAERDYMRLHVGARSFLIHQTLSGLEDRLDPERFIRLHRSTIVRRAAIEALCHQGLGAWSVRLRGGNTARVARSCVGAVKAIVGSI